MRYMIVLLWIGCATVAYPQTIQDDRLLAKFEQKQLEVLSQENPEVLHFWSYFADQGWEVIDMPSGKEHKIRTLGQLEIRKDFNILEVHSTLLPYESQYYQLKDSNQLLRILSRNEFIEKYNTYRAKAH